LSKDSRVTVDQLGHLLHVHIGVLEQGLNLTDYRRQGWQGAVLTKKGLGVDLNGGEHGVVVLILKWSLFCQKERDDIPIREKCLNGFLKRPLSRFYYKKWFVLSRVLWK
jgi:hypothetical protein